VVCCGSHVGCFSCCYRWVSFDATADAEDNANQFTDSRELTVRCTRRRTVWSCLMLRWTSWPTHCRRWPEESSKLRREDHSHTFGFADKMLLLLILHLPVVLLTFLLQEQLPSFALGVVLRSLGKYLIPVLGQLPLVPVGLTAMNWPLATLPRTLKTYSTWLS
jgi:hypothetical protein